MFKCRDCGTTFEEPKIIEEPRGEYHGVPCYEETECCPCCGSYDWDDEYIVDEEEDQ